MFGVVGGSFMLLFGLVIFGYTIYTMVTATPKDTTGWVFSAFYLVGGLVVAYYGYQTLYPPQPLLPGIIGGRRYRR